MSSNAPPPRPPRSNPSASISPRASGDSRNPVDSVAPLPARPDPTALQPSTTQKKKRNHRGGKKKRTRKQSFAASTEDGSGMPGTSQRERQESSHNVARETFYRLQAGRNHSNTSLESEALLDHREQSSMRPRRASTLAPNRGFDSPSSYRPTYQNPFISSDNPPIRRSNSSQKVEVEDDETDERAPLISSSARSKTSPGLVGYSGYGGAEGSRQEPKNRRPSSISSSKSKKRTIFDKNPDQFPTMSATNEEYNVNYPPSVPGSPTLSTAGRDMSFGDMLTNDFNRSRSSSPEHRSDGDIDDEQDTPRFERRHTIAALTASQDVCFPTEGMSEMGDDDMPPRESRNRRRRPRWPDLSVLDDWSRFEKEGRSEERRMKKITEPQLIGGRLRPIHKGWHRAEDDAPYRFTYFNEEFQSTIHSQTISELVQAGSSFRELFVPDRPELSDSSDSEEDEGFHPMSREESHLRHAPGVNGDSRAPTRQSSVADPTRPSHADTSILDMLQRNGKGVSGDATPITGFKSPPVKSPSPKGEKTEEGEKPKRYGDRPTWWLDVLSPTDAEMKVISKTFGIHPLTAEDIMMQEAREKVELFRHYYFVNYRSFEQDMNNEDFLEPVNMYVVVFKEGVISFHFSMTPHPANVRRRIRQLKDYLILSSDWISYAIIDDITDVFAPLIQNIEDEVDDIDDSILKLHSSDGDESSNKDNEKRSEAGDGTSGESGGDMLRRVGDCRKKVMGLYRLLGNKADVIKGFAKRCNEHWDVAPRSEIGLYLGDIQDHIVTMTGNLSHYEKILARSHGNYLAQINIKMNERQEQTADVLGKLTVLGTIVLPMNIITGLWGMNVWVPGQAYEGDLTWFWCLTGGLLVFGLACYFTAKLMYRIV